jgi:hypothetical protein
MEVFPARLSGFALRRNSAATLRNAQKKFSSPSRGRRALPAVKERGCLPGEINLCDEPFASGLIYESDSRDERKKRNEEIF